MEKINRIKGTWLLFRSLFGENFKRTYEWLDYSKDFFVPGADKFFVQGVWDKWPETNPAIRQMELLLEKNPPKSGDSILDIGCGYGGFAWICRKKYPQVKNIVGIDINSDHIREAKLKHGKLPGTKFIEGDAMEVLVPQNPDYPGHKFDRIYLNEISQDIDPEVFDRMIKICSGALTENGSIIIFALTKEAEPQTVFEKIVMEMVIRNGSPDRTGIEDSLKKAGLNYHGLDLTSVSSARLVDRALTDRSVVSGMLLWPFSALMRKTLKSARNILSREGYAVTLYHASKN